MGIELRDDMIISDKDYYSFADNQNPAFKDELFAGLEEEGLSYNSIEQPKKKKTVRLFGLPVFSIES